MGMRKLLLILFIIPAICKAQTPLSYLLPKFAAAPFVPDSALWHFSLTASSQGIAQNVSGDPKTGVRSATHPNGWTISSIATANWFGSGGVSAAQNISGAGTANTYFTELPNTAFINCWFNFGNNVAIYNPSNPHLRVGNLNPAYNYEIRGSGCDGSLTAFDCNPMLMYVSGATSVGPSDNLNGDVTTQANGYVFSGSPAVVKPNGSGQIDIWIVSTTTSTAAVIAVLKVKRVP